MAHSQPGPERPVYTVSELTRAVKLHLESEFYDVWVTGEISNFKPHAASGHWYFTLKDKDSQCAAVMFRSAARLVRFRPADGLAVLARGFITVYEPRGGYQLQIEKLEPRGKGALQLAFEQLKEKLAKEGLFAPERKKPLPLLPRRIGIVTSRSGAAIRDICHILHTRFPNLRITLYPAQVQGDLAAFEIAKGVQVLNRLAEELELDVLIVGRGGGSLEDLWPFNEESVARAISASRLPVISAVGHEVDFTIADFVADVRAATPSAAAELVVARKDHFVERVGALERRLADTIVARTAGIRGRVERLSGHQAFLAVRHRVESGGQKIDESRLRASAAVERKLRTGREKVARLSQNLEALRVDRRLAEARARLTRLSLLLVTSERARLTARGDRLGRASAQLDALSPLAVLGRGYSLTWDATGKLVRDAASVSAGDPVRVTLSSGELDCRVEKSRVPETHDDEA